MRSTRDACSLQFDVSRRLDHSRVTDDPRYTSEAGVVFCYLPISSISAISPQYGRLQTPDLYVGRIEPTGTPIDHDPLSAWGRDGSVTAGLYVAAPADGEDPARKYVDRRVG